MVFIKPSSTVTTVYNMIIADSGRVLWLLEQENISVEHNSLEVEKTLHFVKYFSPSTNILPPEMFTFSLSQAFQ